MPTFNWPRKTSQAPTAQHLTWDDFADLRLVDRMCEYLEIPDVIGGEDGDYILRVKGDSMKDAGILEGDFVVVQRQDTANDGDIVVALVNGEEATLKRLRKKGASIAFARPLPVVEGANLTLAAALAAGSKDVASVAVSGGERASGNTLAVRTRLGARPTVTGTLPDGTKLPALR